jgi:hypothetical protein
VTIGFLLAFAVPASLGLRDWDVFFVGVLCLFPATVVAYAMVFQVMPPKYVRRREVITTLFHKGQGK